MGGDEQLEAWAREVAYEVWAIRALAERMPPGPDWMPAGPFVESLLLHVRNVLLFRPEPGGRPRSRRHADVTAAMFTADWGLDPETVLLLPGMTMPEVIKACHTELAHITTARLRPDQGRMAAQNHLLLAHTVLGLFERFLEHIGDGRRGWFSFDQAWFDAPG